VFTIGFWLPLWILHSVINIFEAWRCNFCGGGRIGGEIPIGPSKPAYIPNSTPQPAHTPDSTLPQFIALRSNPKTEKAGQAITSLLVPGLGQLLQHRKEAAILFFATEVLLWVIYLNLDFLGWLIPIFHLWACINAVIFDPEKNC
jgi:hypothetical protein